MKIREVMKVLAKILSIVVVILLIWQLYLYFKIIIPWFIIKSLPGTVLRSIIYYIPLFYFAWSKKGKNRVFRIWGGIISLFMAVLLLLSFIFGAIWNFLSDIIGMVGLPYFITNILLIIILGYFSWFDK